MLRGRLERQQRWHLAPLPLLLLSVASGLLSRVDAYQVMIKDTDELRQVCSGMWGSGGSRDPWIEVLFAPSSRGQLALIIYEWADAKYIGIDSDGSGAGQNAWESERVFVCNQAAYQANLCQPDDLGKFIVNTPEGAEQTSIFTTSVNFGTTGAVQGDGQESAALDVNRGPFRYEVTKTGYYCVGAVPVTISSSAPVGQPTTGGTGGDTVGDTIGNDINGGEPGQAGGSATGDAAGQTGDDTVGGTANDGAATAGDDTVGNEVGNAALEAEGEINSPFQNLKRQAGNFGDTSVTVYTGVVDFENTFEGQLPAAEHPKIAFYGFLAVVYGLIGVAWAVLCLKFRREILPIQHYISATIAFIVVEMVAISGYYRYLNNSGTASLANGYLGLVAMLNAARNSISFFMLLIVCMGYGVVRPSLGATMLRVRILALVHFIFGVVYSMGISLIPLESAGIFLFFCVFPLAFSLTAFMMWIMYSLNTTIQDLETRKQSYKKGMFTRLYRILIGAVIVIFAFFVISSMSFSSRLDENYAPDTWQSRWWLLDGWLGLLYLVCFSLIAFLWRPSGNNRRLAMSDELATDEADADEFEVDTLRNNRLDEEEGADGKDGVPGSIKGGRYNGVSRDEVVFDIGDEGDSDDDSHAKNGVQLGRKARRSDESGGDGDEAEGRRLRLSNESNRSDGPPRYDS